ncbi:UDP-N-acetylmuramoyl-L-alanyl-D-glutamate--2,6-diaminopimelate ligase [Borrelia miyamotoi]|uniref:UDP-N-acetylmuramyl-tripeptide synthetase n=1 Tax=Borrelia miyamotoi TaxID=47466 RepID=A0AAQ3AGF0_9SPIR|nr:UDP-N-acetylmuramoyl-L-alanyl-D-glutamate--2,6-diaminopimelate ligase [Borrelia miyamotoi]AJA58941.1 UDP-N-acetylmuramyl peptide synthase [Borrelia miyamotoi]AOW96037.1 UDP-N-acetylmuramyl peptide synthase [Borrelia miyamotoi]QTL83347.1 UDP-N-acetylmuramoyl-L-alanyl-D-glutamate--2,6-diaminopimelate ligase [Borrelia miyamotoi]WAZ85358.1 UDP-N-acetylmuramoyl-L-alanyl-D-glutamate--2,6-diaminopimelate ligase [Borrelia miyamotoi]WAZ91140.1 UDP-N-acetylmuramoyl-L-alanyl-D-glutamate--2,6-diaminopi
MNKKTLNNILSRLDKDLVKGIRGSCNVEILGLTYDSRNVLSNFVFFALPGLHFDGQEFIGEAIQRGSNVIVHTTDVDFYCSNVTYIKIDSWNMRRFMSNFSHIFYNEPSKKLKIIGVTGTDGKSSVCFYIYTLLKAMGVKVGFISTVFFEDGSGTLVKNPYRQSTPESTEIHLVLSKMVENNIEYAIIESTSHGLDFRTSRLIDIAYSVAVLTNVTHEHLEFHGTMNHYLNAKLSLFSSANDNGGFGIINMDDDNFSLFLNSINRAYTYSLRNQRADFFVSRINEQINFTEFEFYHKNIKYDARINLIGSFNVENVMAALIVVNQIMCVDIAELTDKLINIEGLCGRMQGVDFGQDFSLIIDYAHTPGAFFKIFPIFKRLSKNRLISVFGSAGERDVIKRRLQGEIANRYSDIIILCDEDPRGEDSMQVIRNIAEGILEKTLNKDLFFIPDRRSAIEKAISIACTGDLVVTLGKGHESSIIYKDKSIFWDEEAVIKDIILNMNERI